MRRGFGDGLKITPEMQETASYCAEIARQMAIAASIRARKERALREIAAAEYYDHMQEGIEAVERAIRMKFELKEPTPEEIQDLTAWIEKYEAEEDARIERERMERE